MQPLGVLRVVYEGSDRVRTEAGLVHVSVAVPLPDRLQINPVSVDDQAGNPHPASFNRASDQEDRVGDSKVTKDRVPYLHHGPETVVESHGRQGASRGSALGIGDLVQAHQLEATGQPVYLLLEDRRWCRVDR